MRAYVLGDAALAKQAGRFVWLSIDIENERNTAFLSRFPIGAVPTLLVIDDGERVAVTRSSSASALELVKLLDDGERAARGADKGAAEAALAEAEAQAGAGHPKEAAAAFRRALELGGPSWPRRARTVESLLQALSTIGDSAGCAELALGESAHLPHDALFASIVASGLDCALDLAPPARASAQATLEKRTREALAISDLLADDRSGLYDELVSARRSAGDAAAVKQLAGEWLTFLEREAARARTPEARAAFDPHRLAAAIALGEPKRAVPALQASERDLPNDYNPPARLATAYLELGRYDDALAACERASRRVYGPRRLRVEETRASIYQKKGDLAAARRALAGAVALAESLPKDQRTLHTVERLRAQLKALDAK
jgi:tetratricopeptide (TPR) repeat protein